MVGSRHFGSGDHPFKPSHTNKIHERVIDQAKAEDDEPSSRGEGIDVSSWTHVLYSLAPRVPAYDSGDNPAGWQALVRVWRFKNETLGAEMPSGQWYPSEELVVNLDGNPAGSGPAEHAVPTLNSERIWFQIYSISGSPATYSITSMVSGLSRRTDDDRCCPATPTLSGGGAAGGGGAALALADGEWLYSVERGDYGTTHLNATSFTVTDDVTGAPVDIDTDKIVAIGRRAPDGTVDSMDIAVRGVNLGVSTTAPNTVTIGPPTPFTFLATDLISIWVEKEGRSIARDSAVAPDEARAIGGLARETQSAAVTEGDIAQIVTSLYREIILASYTYTTDSNRVEEINPAEEKPVVETLWVDEDIQAAGDIEIPSADGWLMFPFKDYALDIYLEGGATGAPVDVTAELKAYGRDSEDATWKENTNALYSENRDATSQTYSSTGDGGANAFEDLADMDEYNHKYGKLIVNFGAVPDAGTPGKVRIYLRKKVR